MAFTKEQQLGFIKEIIADYEKKEGKVFDFEIDDELHVRITRYYPEKGREEVIIPNFVYGFAYHDTDYAPFSDAENVKSIVLNPMIRDVSYMFYGSNIPELDVGNWNMTAIKDMTDMFNFCSTKFKGIRNWCLLSREEVDYSGLSWIRGYNMDAKDQNHLMQDREYFQAMVEDEKREREQEEKKRAAHRAFLESEPYQKALATIADYEKDHGKVFAFIVDINTNIFVESYYDSPERSHVSIPDFVYGSTAKKEDGEPFPTGMFRDVQYLKSVTMGKNMKNIDWLFAQWPMPLLDVGDWDVSKVRSMRGTFALLPEGVEIKGLDTWDVSQVETMLGMFFGSNLSMDGDLGTWDVSKVIDMQEMFMSSKCFNVDTLASWDAPSLKQADKMFADAKVHGSFSFEKWQIPEDVSLGFATAGLVYLDEEA